jgi:tRNA (guanosine-2'-O-)-methyltransferase
MDKYHKKLSDFLIQFMYERRIDRVDQVLNERTQYLTVVMEDIFQSQNASAVLRSCDCFGIQDVHIIENDNSYKINPDVSMGSDKWLNLHYYNKNRHNTSDCIKHLREDGYRIVATTPHTRDVSLENFDLKKGKAALFFGSEKPGLSSEILEQADEFLRIPMYGFTESFNISVSAAIVLHHLIWNLHNSDVDWRLEQETYEYLRLDWIKKSLKRPDLLIKEFNKLNPHLK